MLPLASMAVPPAPGKVVVPLGWGAGALHRPGA